MPTNPRLDEAIAICQTGAASVPESLNSLTLLIVLKSLRGDVTQRDWDHFQKRLETVPMTRDNARVYLILTYHARKGVPLDKQELLDTFAGLSRRGNFEPFILASLGYFVMNDLSEPDAAIPYFIQAIEATPPKDPFPWQLGNELRAKGRPDLAEKIELIGQAKRNAVDPASAGRPSGSTSD